METTPNSPQELFDLQRGARYELPLVEAVNELISDFDPDPLEVVPVAILILERLERFHFEVLQDPDNGLTEWQKKTWSEDLRHLTKALKFTRLVRMD